MARSGGVKYVKRFSHWDQRKSAIWDHNKMEMQLRDSFAGYQTSNNWTKPGIEAGTMMNNLGFSNMFVYFISNHHDLVSKNQGWTNWPGDVGGYIPCKQYSSKQPYWVRLLHIRVHLGRLNLYHTLRLRCYDGSNWRRSIRHRKRDFEGATFMLSWFERTAWLCNPWSDHVSQPRCQDGASFLCYVDWLEGQKNIAAANN